MRSVDPDIAMRTDANTAVDELPMLWSNADRVLACLLIVLSALPFAAIPLGANSHLPISSVVSGLLILRCRRSSPLMAIAIGTAMIPIVMAFIRMFVDPEPWRPGPTILWVVFTLPLAGTIAAVMILKHRLATCLAVTLLVSALLVIVQKYVFIDWLNTVPFPDYYTMPGYGWVPASDVDLFLASNRRPFGLFPEPSYMTSALSLMAMALVIARLYFDDALKSLDYLALVTAFWAVAASGSGSAAVVLAAIVIVTFVPLVRRRRRVALTMIPPALLGALFLAHSFIADRQSNFNYSWYDRYASIMATMQLMRNDALIFLVGLGGGGVNEAFVRGDVPLELHQHYMPLPDIYSVLGRIVVQYGAIVGLAFVVGMAIFILRTGGRRRFWLGSASLIVWIAVAGVTTSYESVYWIWGIVGLCAGLEICGRRSDAGSVSGR